VGDITCLETTEGWSYRVVLIDLYSRRVVGWSMRERITADLACEALRMAWFRNRRPRDVIVHTDRGSQYCSHAFQDLLERSSLRSSMSRTGDCSDKPVAESFFHTFKVEPPADQPRQSRAARKEMAFQYIAVYYNQQRMHSSIGYRTPEQCERQAVA